MPSPVSPAAPRLLAVLLTTLAVAAPGRAAALDPRCGAPDPAAPGGFRPRMGRLKVTLEDADGRLLEGVVEVDGVRLGPTGKVLPAPVCAQRVKVVAGARTWEQPLEPSFDGFTAVHGRLGAPAAAPAAPAPAAPAPAPGGRARPAPVEVELPSAAPPGMAVVHYHRTDGDYEGWGLHTWESFDNGRPDRAPAGVSWDRPLKPSGHDRFGPYWLLPMRNYGNGVVNFILHAGSEREHCGQDERLLLSRGREAWVVTGVCEAFLSRAEAHRAAQEGAGSRKEK